MKRPTVAEAVARLYAQVDAAWAALPPKRMRKPSFTSIIRQARRAGVDKGTVTRDGVSVSFGESEPTAAVNPWLVGLDEVTKQ